jgi:hypothetical protein
MLERKEKLQVSLDRLKGVIHNCGVSENYRIS